MSWNKVSGQKEIKILLQRAILNAHIAHAVSYTHLTLPTIYSV